MRIGVDGRGLRGGRGIARFTHGILRALPTVLPDAEIHVLLAAGEPVAAPHPELRMHHDQRPQRLLFGAAALTGRPRADKLLRRPDVLWMPAPAPIALTGDVPLVLTVHDLSFAQRPGDFGAYERFWHRLARPEELAARAAAVVCDSEATRRAVTRGWPDVPAARLRVVLPGFDRPTEPTRPWSALPERYLLAVGALEPRKGIDVLLDAFAQARAAGLDADLVLAGDGRLRAHAAGREGVHVLGRITDGRLASCYEHALALVMPSLLEGFGLPPLEAAAHGTPSIVSALPVFDETLGPDGALRVPPGDAEALAGAMRLVAADPELRGRLVAAGWHHAAPLTWERAARGLAAVLEEVAAG